MNTLAVNAIIALLILVTSVTLIMTLDSHIEMTRVHDIDYKQVVDSAMLGAWIGDFHFIPIDDPHSEHLYTLKEVTKQGDQIRIDFSQNSFGRYYDVPEFSFVGTYVAGDTFFPYCLYSQQLETSYPVNSVLDLYASISILKYLGTVEREGVEYFVFFHKEGHLEQNVCIFPQIIEYSHNVVDIELPDISVDEMNSLLNRPPFRGVDAISLIELFELGDDFAQEFFVKYPYPVIVNESSMGNNLNRYDELDLDEFCIEKAKIHLIHIEDALEYVRQLHIGKSADSFIEYGLNENFNSAKQNSIKFGCVESGEWIIDSKYVPDNIKNVVSEKYQQLMLYKDNLHLNDLLVIDD